ncbi:LOW QUALITY PROTEIN: stathmin domain-containing protein 1 [Cyanocitta cristata]
MGCNISIQAAVAQLPSEGLQNNQGVKSQVVTSSPWTPSELEIHHEALFECQVLYKYEVLMFTSFEDTLLTNEFISKSSPLEETEAKIIILEELRMQGIIKSSTTARTGEAYENKRDVLQKTLKKPPARLEKIQFGNEEVGHFTVKDMKPSAEGKKQRKQTEKDCPGFESQGGTDPQPSLLDAEPGVLLWKTTAVDTQTVILRTLSLTLDNLQLHL